MVADGITGQQIFILPFHPGLWKKFLSHSIDVGLGKCLSLAKGIWAEVTGWWFQEKPLRGSALVGLLSFCIHDKNVFQRTTCSFSLDARWKDVPIRVDFSLGSSPSESQTTCRPLRDAHSCKPWDLGVLWYPRKTHSLWACLLIITYFLCGGLPDIEEWAQTLEYWLYHITVIIVDNIFWLILRLHFLTYKIRMK